MRTNRLKLKPPGFRVLVVGGTVASCDLISSLLELQGHEVRIALDALEAVRFALDFVPHVAFIDMQLAIKNHFELPSALRSLHETRNCKFIVTGDDGLPDLRALKQAGLRHLLARPINLGSVARAVDEVNGPPLLLS